MLSSLLETHFQEHASPLPNKLEMRFANHESLMLSNKLETLLFVNTSPLSNNIGDAYCSNRVSYRGQSETRCLWGKHVSFVCT
jgi:hypothetical protein